MKKIGIMPNFMKADTLRFAEQLQEYLEKKSQNVVLLPQDGAVFPDLDVVIVLGGDGTILRTANKINRQKTALLGINFGHIGYLAEATTENAWQTIDQLVNGEYRVDHRLTLQGQIIRDGKTVQTFSAINEASLYRASLRKAFGVKVFVNDEYTYSVFGDGILVATPTGSTGYNLSNQGPVLSPNLQNMVVTPICSKFFPHSSLVVEGNDQICLEVETDEFWKEGVELQVDADQSYPVQSGDKILLSRGKDDLSIVRVTEKSFYQTFSERLAKMNYEKR